MVAVTVHGGNGSGGGVGVKVVLWWLVHCKKICCTNKKICFGNESHTTNTPCVMAAYNFLLL